MRGELPDFVTPIHVFPGDQSDVVVTEGGLRLPPEVAREVQAKLDAFDAARAAALVSSQFYIVRGAR